MSRDQLIEAVVQSSGTWLRWKGRGIKLFVSSSGGVIDISVDNTTVAEAIQVALALNHWVQPKEHLR
jgi:hypothetical protein